MALAHQLRKKGRSYLSRLFLVFLGSVVVVSILLPIYTDEALFPIMQGMPPKLGRLLYLFPQCHQSYEVSVPYTHWPAYLFSLVTAKTFYSSGNPIFLRLAGILGAVIFIGILSWWVYRNAQPKTRLDRVVFALLPIGVGISPLLLTLNRPEQNIGIWMLVLIILAVEGRKKLAWTRTWLGVAATVLLYSFAVFEHPLAGYLLPVALLAIWTSPVSLATRLIGLGGIFFLIWETVVFWKARGSCPDIAPIETAFRANGTPNLNPIDWIKIVLNSLTIHGDPWLLHKPGFSGHHQSYWIPNTALPKPLQGFNALTKYAVSTLLVLVAVATTQRTWLQIRRKKPENLAFVFAFTIIVGSLALWLIYPGKTFYVTQIQTCLWSIALACFLVGTPKGGLLFRPINGIATFVSFLLIVSQPILLTRFLTDTQDYLNPGYPARQPFSFSAFQAGHSRETVRSLSKRCRIELEQPANRRVVDEFVHQLFPTTVKPGISFFMNFKSPNLTYEETLKKAGYLEGVSRCSFVESWNIPIEREGDLCCFRL